MEASPEEIYGALTRGDWEMVRKLCQEHPEGPFLQLTKRKSSVLQKALYSKQVELALELFDDAQKLCKSPEEFEEKLVADVTTKKDTILHLAATHDSCIPAAEKIFECTSKLLFYKNERQEIPIVNAVRYGQRKMFKFLDSKIAEKIAEEDRLCKYRVSNERNNQFYNILHVAIYNEHYEMALYIATTYPSLICDEDHNKLTSLHLLAMNPSAFITEDWKCLEHLFPSPFPCLYKILHKDYLEKKKISHKEDATDVEFKKAADMDILQGLARDDDSKAWPGFTMYIPCWERSKESYRRYQAALLLGAYLVIKDISWIHKLVTTSGSKSDDDDDDDDESPNPLLLATKYGCTEIALNILKKHPQTVEQTGREGSVLHLAIRYRRTEIIDALFRMSMQMRKLVRWGDDEGNSILHMVALNTPKTKVKNGSDATSTDKPKSKLLHPWDAEVTINETRSPAFEMQEDLVLFERVEEILKTNYHKRPNDDLQTPEQLFAEKKELLRDAAQEYMKRTAENCSLVAVLIATVAFAAAYTVPGGTSNGFPVLLDQTFFVVFTITDVLSLASTLTAIVIFLSILTSPFRFQDFRATLPKSLMFGIGFLIFSLAMMMLAFAATIILMIKNRQQWTRIALYAVAFLPVTMLVVSYMPFYVPLRQTFLYSVKKVSFVLPRFRVTNSQIKPAKKPIISSQIEQGRRCCSCLFV